MHCDRLVRLPKYAPISGYNLQATKLFIVTSATKGGYHPIRISVSFKILYRVV